MRRWFKGDNPPSRSCVSVKLPEPSLVMLDLVALRGTGEDLQSGRADSYSNRMVLHVRSLSSWAPVCIGPYSQANAIGPSGSLCLIAGQIGLDPASMMLPKGATTTQTPSASLPVHHAVGGTTPRPNSTGGGEGGSVCQGEGTGEVGSVNAAVACKGTFYRWWDAQVQAELELCVRNAAAVAGAISTTLSKGCLFATLYIAESSLPTVTVSSGEGRFQLGDIVDECRTLMEGNAGVLAAVGGGSSFGARAGMDGEGEDFVEDEDSAEEGWTSDPEELAKEAAKKKTAIRRVPILPLVVPSLPKASAVELEVLCVTQGAQSLLPCTYHHSINKAVLTNISPRPSLGCPLPTPFALRASPSQPLSGAGRLWGKGEGGNSNMRLGGSISTASVEVEATLVDRVLCVALCSLSLSFGREPLTASGGVENVVSGVDETKSRTVALEGMAVDESHSCSVSDSDYRATAPGAAVAVAPHAKWSLSTTQLECACKELLGSLEEALLAARLKWQDVAHLRVYHYDETSTLTFRRAQSENQGVRPWQNERRGDTQECCVRSGPRIGAEGEALRSAVLLALAGRTRERPGLTLVPVSGLPEGVEVCLHATGLDLPCLRSLMWIRGES